MTPEDATARIADGMGHLAGSLDRLTQHVSALAQPTHALLTTTRRLARMTAVLYVLLALALVGVGALAWQDYELHQQTRVIVQTNQALLQELLQRTPRQP